MQRGKDITNYCTINTSVLHTTDTMQSTYVPLVWNELSTKLSTTWLFCMLQKYLRGSTSGIITLPTVLSWLYNLYRFISEVIKVTWTQHLLRYIISHTITWKFFCDFEQELMYQFPTRKMKHLIFFLLSYSCTSCTYRPISQDTIDLWKIKSNWSARMYI